jgi:hypothetical protein
MKLSIIMEAIVKQHVLYLYNHGVVHHPILYFSMYMPLRAKAKDGDATSPSNSGAKGDEE